MEKISVEEFYLNEERRLKFGGRLSKSSVELLRTLPQCRWSSSIRNWHCAWIQNYMEFLIQKFGDSLYFTDTTPADPRRVIEDQRECRVYIKVDLERDQFSLRFPYNPKLLKLIKTLEKPRYNPEDKIWNLPRTAENSEVLKKFLQKHDFEVVYQVTGKESGGITEPKGKKGSPHEKSFEGMGRFVEELQFRGYSNRTIEQYSSIISIFLGHVGDPGQLDTEEIIIFIQELTIDRNFSKSYQNAFISAIKIYYRLVHKRDIKEIEVPRPKLEQRLPVVLSKEEIKKLLDSVSNLKHRTALTTIYATGMRCNEFLNLKLEDIDYDRGIIFIESGKGGKDRILSMGESLRSLISLYREAYRPKVYFIESLQGGKYSSSSLRMIMKRALKKSGIIKRATIHTLRHSYATHCLESGINLRTIQELLGHSSSRTTEIYTHISRKSIKEYRSPFEDL